MKKIIVITFAILLLVGCSDDISKNDDLQPRVEFSDCTACMECTEEFSCPDNAIKFDTEHLTAYIDVNECTQCLDCIDDFSCPDNAFRTDTDEIAPGNITDLSVSSDSVGYATISFTAPGDDANEGKVFEYDVKIYNGDQLVQFDYDFDHPLPAGQTEVWAIANLPESQTLTIKIQAFDEVDNSNETAQANVEIMAEEIDEIAPASINDLSAQAMVESVLLSWTAPGDDDFSGNASGYIIKSFSETITDENWDLANLIDNQIVPANPGSQELKLIDNLPANQVVFFAVKAFDDADNLAELSNIASAIPNEPEDLTAPASINNLSAQIVDENFVLNWTATGDDEIEGTADAYDLRWSNSAINADNFDNAEQIDELPAPQSAGSNETFTFATPQINIEYYFAIKAVDDNDNWSEISNIVQIMLEEEIDETAPAQISDLVVSTATSEFVLSWTAVGDDEDQGQAAQYDLRYSTELITNSNFDSANQANGVQSPAIAGTEENYTFTDFNYDQTYYFAIKTIDEMGNISLISNVVNAEIADPTDVTNPGNITDVSVQAGPTSSYSRITISFTAPGDDDNQGTADHYIIKYSSYEITAANWNLASTFTNSIQPLSAGNTEIIQVTGLDEGELYYFAVVAVDEAGNESDVSNSPAGKIVFAIDEQNCIDCSNCIYDCDEGAISDAGPYKTIDPDICVACGDCSCPHGLIDLVVIGY